MTAQPLSIQIPPVPAPAYQKSVGSERWWGCGVPENSLLACCLGQALPGAKQGHSLRRTSVEQRPHLSPDPQQSLPLWQRSSLTCCSAIAGKQHFPDQHKGFLSLGCCFESCCFCPKPRLAGLTPSA